jgi:hypothetical protein
MRPPYNGCPTDPAVIHVYAVKARLDVEYSNYFDLFVSSEEKRRAAARPGGARIAKHAVSPGF